eukprot:SAG31_NODE_3269_length_4478_cov_2.680521_4_plen_103_part_00
MTGPQGTLELNRIRSSLTVFKQLGFGLRQPALDRTKLCELADSDLDPAYVRQRDQLKAMVYEEVLARPKMLSAKYLDGRGLADFVRKVGTALNERYARAPML